MPELWLWAAPGMSLTDTSWGFSCFSWGISFIDKLEVRGRNTPSIWKELNLQRLRCLHHNLLFLRNPNVLSLISKNNNISFRWWVSVFKILNKSLKSATRQTVWNHRNSLHWHHQCHEQMRLLNLISHFKIHLGNISLWKSHFEIAQNSVKS